VTVCTVVNNTAVLNSETFKSLTETKMSAVCDCVYCSEYSGVELGDIQVSD